MNLLDAALAWHDAGGCILPVANDGSKRPDVGSWIEYQSNRPTREQVTGWASNHDGVGLVTGGVSGNMEMLEVEGGAVARGMHIEYRNLVEAVDPGLWLKLNTYVEASPSGGIHWIYRIDGAPVAGNTKLARHRNDEGHPVCDMETRGEKGFTILPPSAGRAHPTGKPWVLVSGKPGQVPTLTADEVATLHRLARTFDEVPDVVAPSEPRPVVRKAGERTPGDDFNDQADWNDILVPAGWRVVGHRGDITLWRRPGKNVGISATTGFGDGDWLYVFSTSTEFESERTYTKLGAYAVLNHHGDYSAAAGELRKKGLGSPLQPQERTNPLTLIQGDGPEAPGATGGDSVEEPPTWAPVDLTAFLDGSHIPQVPELMVRADGNFLLYRGRVHSFHGESESGKSWLALAAAVPELILGHDVLMIDFESDAHTTVGRLLRMGVPADMIRAHFHYVRPEVSPEALAREAIAWVELLGRQYVLAIIDGVTEALSVYGVVSKDNDEVTGWIRQVPRRIAGQTGAAVVLVDHVTKDADSRGRFAIGGQAKMAALDGAAYVIEVIDPLGVGLVGRVAMRVAKDRPGGVRPQAGAWRKSDRTQEAAVITVDSSQSDVTTITVEKPRDDLADENGERKPFQPTGYMERVSKALENANAAMSRNAITTSIAGRKDMVLQAVDILIEGGYLAADGPSLKGRPSVRLIRPYREGADSVPASDVMDLIGEGSEGFGSGSRSNDRGTGEPHLPPSDRFPGNRLEPNGTAYQIPLDSEGDL